MNIQSRAFAIALVGLSSAMVPLLAAAQHTPIYKCSERGRAVFQDKPCSSGGEQLRKSAGASVSFPGLIEEATAPPSGRTPTTVIGFGEREDRVRIVGIREAKIEGLKNQKHLLELEFQEAAAERYNAIMAEGVDEKQEKAFSSEVEIMHFQLQESLGKIDLEIQKLMRLNNAEKDKEDA